MLTCRLQSSLYGPRIHTEAGPKAHGIIARNRFGRHGEKTAQQGGVRQCLIPTAFVWEAEDLVEARMDFQAFVAQRQPNGVNLVEGAEPLYPLILPKGLSRNSDYRNPELHYRMACS